MLSIPESALSNFDVMMMYFEALKIKNLKRRERSLRQMSDLAKRRGIHDVILACVETYKIALKEQRESGIKSCDQPRIFAMQKFIELMPNERSF